MTTLDPTLAPRVGIDIVDIPRFRRFVGHADEAQLLRIFTEAECAYAHLRRDPVPRLAARFAAKEAVIKVLEEVDAFALDWREIEIESAEGHAPRLRLGGSMATLAEALKIRAVSISMSHCASYAVGQALATHASSWPSQW